MDATQITGTFTLSIQLNNGWMCTQNNVAHALELVARRLLEFEDEGEIKDHDGNVVGSYAFQPR